MQSLKHPVLLILLVLVSSLGLQALAPPLAHASTSYTWTGNGNDGKWNNSVNWAPNGIPSNGDSVAIAPAPGASNASVTSVPQGLTLTNFTLSGSSTNVSGGSLTVTGSFSWSGNGTLATSVTVTGTANISDNGQKILDATSGSTAGKLTMAGITTLSGTGLTLKGPAILTNSGTFTPLADSTILASCCVNPAQFVNIGTIMSNVGAGNTFSLSGVAFTNRGMVNLKSGTFQFADPGYTQTAGSTVLNGGGLTSTSLASVNLQGGVLSGNGTITANVESAALLNPGNPASGEGRITINGNYTQTKTGLIHIDLKGTSPGSTYDQLVVSGAASLDGTLEFALAPGFTPKGTDFFTVATFTIGIGQFAHLQSSSTSRRYWVDYRPRAAVLSYGPWGVDSDGQITSSFYTSVQQTYGTPDFWGRYIGDDKSSFVTTTQNPCSPTTGPNPYQGKDIIPTELATAHSSGLAIVPIYFNFSAKPDAVRGMINGKLTHCGEYYADSAIEFAQHFPIPVGTVIFVDIEYQFQPDAEFLRGWYDEFNKTFMYISPYDGKLYTYQAGYYKAGYYADTGSPNANPPGLFNVPYCAAVGQEPAIGTNSFIWSSRALLSGRTPKATEPAYTPKLPLCANQTFAWQYGTAPLNPPPPNVDTDEALTSLPLWYP